MSTPNNLYLTTDPSTYVADPKTLLLCQRFQQLRTSDPKDLFIQELILECDELRRYGFTTGSMSDLQTLYDRTREELSNLKQQVTQESFAVFLIDGNTMIFHEELLQLGEKGGKYAATILRQGILSSLQDDGLSPTEHVDIHCHCYADVEGIAGTLFQAGIVQTPARFIDFVRGFNNAHHHVNFVDVGFSATDVYSKIKGVFNSYIKSTQCRHIFLGVSDHDTFTPCLEDTLSDVESTRKIALAEGLPLDGKLSSFKDSLTTVKFGNLFRTEQIAMPVPPDHPPTPDSLARSTADSTGIHGKSAGTNNPHSPMTWAAKVAIAATRPPTPPSRTSSILSHSAKEPLIPRNRKGQRIDPADRDYNKREVERMRKLKLCNAHYLLKNCPKGSKCEHDHGYNISKTETEILKRVARMSPCLQGIGCDNPKCIYGHRCPYPRRENCRKGDLDEGKSCIMGRECKFGVEMHDVDCTIVKVVTVR